MAKSSNKFSLFNFKDVKKLRDKLAQISAKEQEDIENDTSIFNSSKEEIARKAEEERQKVIEEQRKKEEEERRKIEERSKKKKKQRVMKKTKSLLCKIILRRDLQQTRLRTNQIENSG